jgi:hypothetical protein
VLLGIKIASKLLKVRWKEYLRMERCKHILKVTEEKHDKWVRIVYRQGFETGTS